MAGAFLALGIGPNPARSALSYRPCATLCYVRSIEEIRQPPFSRFPQLSIKGALGSLVSACKAGVEMPLDRLLTDFRLDAGGGIPALAGGLGDHVQLRGGSTAAQRHA